MLKRLIKDSLLLFFILGIVFLGLAFPAAIFNPEYKQVYQVVEMDLERQVEIAGQGFASNGTVRVHNPNLHLFYSVDGGDHYTALDGQELKINTLKNSPLIYRNTSLRWRHPKGDFPTVTSVMIKLRDEAKHVESQPGVYTFIDPAKSALPVVCITTSEAGLFSWDNGIMIYGEESSHETGFQKEWWYRSANFAGRGSEWARPAHFQYFKQGGLLAEQTCEMKISGNATRYFPQKSLKFQPLDSLGKKSKIAYPFWGDEGAKKSKSFLLRQSGNDNGKTLFADLLMHQLAAESNVLVLNGFPVSVFLNGNYWGIYNLRERVDAYFIAKRENVDDDEVTILYCEVYGDRTLLKSGDENVKADFDQLIAGLPAKGEIISDGAYESLKEKISFKSFIDYIIFETYFGNQDWLHNNTTWYKADDKKWKWLLNDLDYSLAYPGEGNLTSNLFDKLRDGESITAKLFQALFSHKKFRKKFKERVTELMEENLSDERIDAVYQNLKRQYEEDIDLQINRWRFIHSREAWEKDCQNNVTFLKERRKHYLKQVEDLE